MTRAAITGPPICFLAWLIAVSVTLVIPSRVLGQAEQSAAVEAIRPFLIRPFAGVGLTSRSVERPTTDAMQAFTTGFVPAVEVGLQLEGWRDAALSLAVLLHYQTSIGLVATETPAFAPHNRLSIRSERIELSVAPSLRLGDSGTSPRMALALGASARTLWPGEHTETMPGYSLIGPQARVELVVPVVDAISVRIAPEVQWIVAMDAALRRAGVGLQGFAWGGEVGMTLALGGTWLVGVHYRQSHAIASHSFEDIERYVTARAEGGF